MGLHIVTGLLAATLLGAPVPTIDRPVTDLAAALSPEDEQALSRKLTVLRDEHGVQMAVLVIQTTGGVPIEDYSMRVARSWGGGVADRDDGLLFTLAIADRRMRLEVGYGLEGAISDSMAKRVLRSVHHLLRKEDYAGAVDAVIGGVTELVAALPPGLRAPFSGWWLTLSLLLGALLGWLLPRLMSGVWLLARIGVAATGFVVLIAWQPLWLPLWLALLVGVILAPRHDAGAAQLIRAAIAVAIGAVALALLANWFSSGGQGPSMTLYAVMFLQPLYLGMWFFIHSSSWLEAKPATSAPYASSSSSTPSYSSSSSSSSHTPSYSSSSSYDYSSSSSSSSSYDYSSSSSSSSSYDSSSSWDSSDDYSSSDDWSGGGGDFGGGGASSSW